MLSSFKYQLAYLTACFINDSGIDDEPLPESLRIYGDLDEIYEKLTKLGASLDEVVGYREKDDASGGGWKVSRLVEISPEEYEEEPICYCDTVQDAERIAKSYWAEMDADVDDGCNKTAIYLERPKSLASRQDNVLDGSVNLGVYFDRQEAIDAIFQKARGHFQRADFSLLSWLDDQPAAVKESALQHLGRHMARSPHISTEIGFHISSVTKPQ